MIRNKARSITGYAATVTDWLTVFLGKWCFENICI